jgi:hypothetical protein
MVEGNALETVGRQLAAILVLDTTRQQLLFGRLHYGGEPVVQLGERNSRARSPTLSVFVAIEPDLDRVREIRKEDLIRHREDTPTTSIRKFNRADVREIVGQDSRQCVGRQARRRDASDLRLSIQATP